MGTLLSTIKDISFITKKHIKLIFQANRFYHCAEVQKEDSCFKQINKPSFLHLICYFVSTLYFFSLINSTNGFIRMFCIEHKVGPTKASEKWPNWHTNTSLLSDHIKLASAASIECYVYQYKLIPCCWQH